MNFSPNERIVWHFYLEVYSVVCPSHRHLLLFDTFESHCTIWLSRQRNECREFHENTRKSHSKDMSTSTWLMEPVNICNASIRSKESPFECSLHFARIKWHILRLWTSYMMPIMDFVVNAVFGTVIDSHTLSTYRHIRLTPPLFACCLLHFGLVLLINRNCDAKLHLWEMENKFLESYVRCVGCVGCVGVDKQSNKLFSVDAYRRDFSLFSCNVLNK